MLKKVYKYLTRFAYAVGKVNSWIIFTLIFFTVVGLYSIVIKFFILFKKSSADEQSYWIEKIYSKPTIENLKKMF